MRNTLKVLLGGAAAVALFATVGGKAMAADYTPAPVVQGYSWTGFYIGGHAGYGEATFEGTFDGAAPVQHFDDLDLNGFVGGGHAGYNWQLDGFGGLGTGLVLGIEGDVSFVDWDDSENNCCSDSIDGDVDLLASIRGRLGIAFDRVLVYGTGGVAFTDASFEAHGTFFDDSDDFNDVGGVVGGGVEYAVWDNVSVGAEGLFYFFDDDQGAATFDEAWVVRGRVSIQLGDLFGGGLFGGGY